MENYALEVNNVTKVYKLYDKQFDRLKEAFNPFKNDYHKKFYALDDVTFNVKVGEKIGIIGANGAGKSTLLKIITGVLNQSSGKINVNGKIAALLELGAGFNMDYTGMENIYLNGTLMGYNSDEMEEKAKKIMEFADIGDFIDQPVKSYSSGMFVRLAFATQIFSEPDILIVDEALSVGDIRFQQKCFRAMESIMKNKTVILVTHDTAAVTRFCQRVVWINRGQKMYDGEVTEGLKQYQGYILQQAIEEKEKVGGSDFDYGKRFDSNVKDNKIHLTHKKRDIPEVLNSITPKGDGNAQITNCALFDLNGETTELIEPKQKLEFVMQVYFKKEIIRPIIGMTIRDRLGNEVFGINSEMLKIELQPAKDFKEYALKFVMPQLNKGEYTISVAVANGFQDDHIQLCWLDDVWIFRIGNREYDIPGMLYISEGDIDDFSIIP